MDPLLVAFLGYIVGALFRTVYDYGWKIMEDPKLVWNQQYTITFLFSTILSVISAMFTFSAITIPVGLTGSFAIFLITLSQGFMINHIVNKPVTYLMERRTTSVAA